ncbi:MAG: TonB-dependent receptor [Acidobacteriota bacterium]
MLWVGAGAAECAWASDRGPAGGTVSGTVSDASGGVLPGVLVTATDASSGRVQTSTSTGAGRYELTLAAGSYRVVAELAGFAAFTVEDVVVTAGSARTLDAVLAVASYGDTVVVTGSRSPESLRTAPAAVSVLSGADLTHTPATNFGDLLRTVPGVNVTEVSVRDVQITTRTAAGANASSTLALVDGRSVYQDYFGMVLWDLVPLDFDDLKQVEVARGPGSAVWGANALSGTINLVTKTPAEDRGTRLRVGLGERGTRDLAAAHGGGSGRLSYRASGSYYAQDNWSRPAALPDGTPLQPYRNRGTTQVKAALRADLATSATSGWRFDLGAASSGGLLLTSAGPFEARVLRQAYGSAIYTRDTASVTGYVTAHRARYDGLLTTTGSAADSQSYQLEARDSRVVAGKHLLVYGASARASHFDLSFVPAKRARRDTGAYLTDDLQVSSRVRVSAGVRTDWIETSGVSLSPRVGVRVDPAPGQTLRATYNRAYIAPSLVQNYIDFASPLDLLLPTGPFQADIRVLGDEQLQPQTADGVELGYTADLGRRATVTVSAYRTRTTGLLAQRVVALYTPADPPAGWPLPLAALAAIPLPKLIRWGRVGDVVEAGVETSLEVRLAPQVSFASSYAFQATPDVTGDDPAVTPLVNIAPRHRAHAGLTWSAGAWLGQASITETARALWTDVLAVQGWTRGYTLVNATAGRRVGAHATVIVKGTNLFDQQVQHHVFGDIIGRRVMAELRLRP